MIQLLDILTFILSLSYAFVFFCIVRTFLPLRKNWPMRILAFWASGYLSLVVVYSNDLESLLGTFLGFCLYVTIFHGGRWMEKMTAVLIFCPAIIAVNYLMQDIGSRCFFWVTNAPGDPANGWTQQQWLISTVFYTCSVLLRLLFWIGAWKFLRKYLLQITHNLTTKMWLIVDTLVLSCFVSIFTIIYFMPENPVIVYPICGAAIFSSFGCIYLASYICTSVQMEYRTKELEMKQEYFADRMSDEERVRSIYHDMKNHLLVIQAQAENSGEILESVVSLQEQIQEYENYYNTGNEFLNIIIRDKARIAREKQIDFTSAIHFEQGSFMDPLDVSTIFGNALDNAIEASDKLPVSMRLITAKANRIRDMLVIVVENNSIEEKVERVTTKSDAFLHGFGLPNIRRAVDKYGGECMIDSQGTTFVLKIMIPIPIS